MRPEYRPTKGDAKRLAKDVRPGDVLYTIAAVDTRDRIEDPFLTQTWRVGSKRDLFTLAPYIEGGRMTTTGLLAQFGTVYTRKPARRDVNDAVPQVAAPDPSLATWEQRERQKAGAR